MILGRKIGMTQVWDEDDNVVPVTVIQAGPCAVSQVKTQATDGYDAVQIGFGDIKAKNVNKPMAGHFAKAGVEPVRFLREVRVENGEEHKVGEVVTVADFADVEKVDVIGTSKGKGFQGRIKRWGQRRGPMTHGSHFQRHPGSIGQCAYPARVLKGVKMAGHMGNERVTARTFPLSASMPSRTSSWSRALSRVPRMVSSPSVWPKGPAHLAQRHTKENT